MAPLNTTDLIALGRRVASELDDRLQVEGVVAAEGGAGRAELLVTIAGCHSDTCTVSLNIDRSQSEHAEHELIAKLTEALATHLTE